MEAELTVDRPRGARPGHVRARHRRSLAMHETPVLQRRRGRSTAACSTRAAAAGRTAPGERTIFSLNTVDPGRRRGQLRPPRPGAAEALHRRQRRDDVRRARRQRRARRAAGRDAGDPARRRTSARTSTAAGPAARCSCRRGATTARPGRSCTSSSACARTWAAARSRSSRSCRPPSPIAGSNIRLGKGALKVVQAAQGRRPLHDHGRHGLRGRPRSLEARRDAAAHREGRVGHARRQEGRLAAAHDQPRPRGHDQGRRRPHTVVVTAR